MVRNTSELCMHQLKTATHDGKQSTLVLAILSFLMAFASISTDIYLPAMPTMSTALGTSPGALAWTVSGYLIGFSLGQLVWGPISDRFGRRKPIAIGVVIFMLGSVGCAVSGSLTTLIGWRLVQAFGACAGVVLSRAMVRDLYSGDEAARMISTLMVAMGVAPLLGPIVGGQILAVAGWRPIFWTQVAAGGVILGAVLILPETLAITRRQTSSLLQIVSRYGGLLFHRRFMANTCAGGFFFFGTFAYVAGSPFAYITYYHVPPGLYGFLFGAGIIGVMTGSFVNARLVTRFGAARLLYGGSLIGMLAGVVLALTSRTDIGGFAGLFIPLLVYVSMTGLVIANSFAGALAEFPAMAGSASALVGALQYGSGMLGTALVGWFADGTPWPLGCIILAAGIGSVVCARLARHWS